MTTANEPRGKWLWNLLRGKSRRDRDRMQVELLRGKSERRKYAGDPNQARHYWVRTRNR